jgi:hypothetical protein
MRALTDVTFDQWCASSQRRAYDRDVFVPSLVPELQNPKHYNRFQGLNIQYKDCRDADVSVCEPLLAHVRKILCKNNEEAYNFVLKTFARIVQGVEKGHLNWIKAQVCIIFLSKQGSGKGTLTRHFRRILTFNHYDRRTPLIYCLIAALAACAAPALPPRCRRRPPPPAGPAAAARTLLIPTRL